MFGLINLEVVAQAAYGKHRHADQDQHNRAGAGFRRWLRFGFLYYLDRLLRLRCRCGFRLRFHWLSGFFRILLGKGHQVGLCDCIEEVDVFRIALLVNDQIKDVFILGHNGIKLLFVLTGGVIQDSAGSVWGKGVRLGSFLRFGGFLHRRGFRLRFVTLCISGNGKGAKAHRKGGQHHKRAQLILHHPFPPVPPDSVWPQAGRRYCRCGWPE